MPAVTRFRTGRPIIAALPGRLLAAVVFPNPLPVNRPTASAREGFPAS